MTDETKHTSGPWWIGYIDDFDGIAILYEEGRVPVANVQTGYSDRDGRANADLISAAPEMFEAIYKIINNWSDLHPKDLHQARAAISKAEGRSK